MLDYRIETFLTLYELMNYRRTAQALNMTQPGVTGHIRWLEENYGVKLFYYDGRQLHKTPYAHQLKQHIARVRADEKALRTSFADPGTLHLNIGATKTIGEFVLPQAICSFLQKGATADLMIDNTENLLRCLQENKLDFAVIEGVFDKSLFPHHLFKEEQFTGICSKDDPFAGQTVTIGQLLQRTIVLREQGSGTRLLLERALEDRGYSVKDFAKCISVSNFSLISHVTASCGAVTFAYAPVAAADDRLATFSVKGLSIQGQFNFVYCSEEAARPAIRAFLGEE